MVQFMRVSPRDNMSKFVSRFDYATWLYRPDLELFVTVTLKQALQSEHGTLKPISKDDIRKTARHLRDRLTKALVGQSAYKKGRRFAFLVFCEGDGSMKRFHLHIVAAKPWDMPRRNYAELVRSIARKLEWVHGEIDVRPIEIDTAEDVIMYSMKEGRDAFLLEASFTSSK